MPSQGAVRWGGVAAIFAALLLPVGSLGRLLSDTDAALTISIANVGFVFLIFALTGIGRVLVDEIGAPGFFVVIAGTVGAVLLVADGVVSAYVYPVLDEESLVKVQGSLGLALVSALGPLALLTAATLLAFVAGRAPAVPKRAAWIMLAGASLATLTNVVAPANTIGLLGLVADLVFAVGLAWTGFKLLSYSPDPGGV